MRRNLLFLLLATASCGHDDEKRSNQGEAKHPEATYPEACLSELPPDLVELIASTQRDNTAARDLAVAAERSRLGVEALSPTTRLGTTTDGMTAYVPEVDPFPDSVVATGDLDYDVRKNGYQLNHGKPGMSNVYETSPGSQRYFIVDLVDGDGIGGNGSEVLASAAEYGLADPAPATVEGHSWHSWHASDDNVLVRATQKPEDAILREVTMCGCGGREEASMKRDESSGKVAARSYDVAIFMLPGQALPRLGEETFEATYKRSLVRQSFVPRVGAACRQVDPNQSC
jgi:hypothetical protein